MSDLVHQSGGELIPQSGGELAVIPAAAKAKGQRKAKKLPPIVTSNDLARRYTERMVNLMQERQDVSDQIKDLSASIKSDGLMPNAIKIVAKRQLETADERAKREALEEEVDMLVVALGEFAATPLGQHAVGATA